MSINSAGWVSWATVVLGLEDKQYAEPNTGIGIACHSMVGSTTAALSRFMSEMKGSDGRYTPYAAASCTFLLNYAGQLIQMYPITASTWTSGSRGANTQYIPVELEGGPQNNPGEPMTDMQVSAFVMLVRELEEHKGIRYIPNVNMLQHKQLAAMFGSAPTACASDRYQRAYDVLMAEDDEMTREETQAMIDAAVAPLKAQLDSLNKALMDRFDLFEIGAGPIEGVRDAIKKLEGGH